MSPIELARDVLEIFADASAARGHRRAPKRYRWPLWAPDERDEARRRVATLARHFGRGPMPACVVCGRACSDWRAKTCSIECHAKRSAP